MTLKKHLLVFVFGRRKLIRSVNIYFYSFRHQLKCAVVCRKSYDTTFLIAENGTLF